MVMRRGDIWWAALRAPAGSEPGYRRPVLVVQSNDFNDSTLRTVVCAVITSNVRLAAAPGNVLLAKRATRLPNVSVVNVSQLITVDKRFLTDKVSRLPPARLRDVEAGLRLVLGNGS
jgi:mRNA interferase MazF